MQSQRNDLVAAAPFLAAGSGAQFKSIPVSADDVDIATAGAHYVAHRRALGRKKSTLEDYESTLRVHLVPFFGQRPIAEIDVMMVEAFIFAKLDEGKAPKSIRNYVGLLHSILDHGVKRGWCT